MCTLTAFGLSPLWGAKKATKKRRMQNLKSLYSWFLERILKRNSTALWTVSKIKGSDPPKLLWAIKTGCQEEWNFKWSIYWRMRAHKGQSWFTWLYLAFSSREARILSIKALTELILIPDLSLPEHPLKCQQAYVVEGSIKGRKTSHCNDCFLHRWYNVFTPICAANPALQYSKCTLDYAHCRHSCWDQ